MEKCVLIFLLTLIILISGCASEAEKTKSLADIKSTDVKIDQPKTEVSDIKAPSDKADQQEPVADKTEKAGLVELSKNYYRYDPNAYQKAISEGKTVFLSFYANWCPICISEEPEIRKAFHEGNWNDVVGFQVHYNDGDTKDFDLEISKKFGIPRQHTKVIIDSKENIKLKTSEVLTQESLAKEIEKARGS